MPRPTEIVDHLLDRVGGLDRRDLEQRLKGLRADGLWPTARRVDDRAAEPVTAEHCANLILAIVGSNTATGAPAAASAFSALPKGESAEVDDNVFVFMGFDEDPSMTLGQYLAKAIGQWRKNYSPLSTELHGGELIAHHGDPRAVYVTFREKEPQDKGPVGYIVPFVEPTDEAPAMRVDEMRQVPLHIIGVMAEFLGIEYDAEDTAA